MLKGAPVEWLNHLVGFVEYLKHFVSHVYPTTDNKAFIIMDNQSTHVNIQVVDFARKNHLIILTQPYIAVCSPFKSRYKQDMNN